MNGCRGKSVRRFVFGDTVQPLSGGSGKIASFTINSIYSEEGKIPDYMIRALTGEHDPSKKSYNPRRRVFLEIAGLTNSTASSVIIDPWGTPYRAAMDSDYSGEVGNSHDDDGVLPNGKHYLGHNLIIWSKGPNRKTNLPTDPSFDDIRSW